VIRPLPDRLEIKSLRGRKKLVTKMKRKRKSRSQPRTRSLSKTQTRTIATSIVIF